jgi:hypothetical protein
VNIDKIFKLDQINHNMKRILTHYESNPENSNRSTPEILYNTLKELYHNGKALTFNELKQKELHIQLSKLEQLTLIEKNIEYTPIIENSKYIRTRKYSLSKKGAQFLKDIEEHMDTHQYTRFSQIKQYFIMSLDLDTERKMFDPEILNLRKKLKKISKEYEQSE